MSGPADIVAAWLAGLNHVLKCKGCPACKVPDGYVPPGEKKPDDDTPLDESVKPNYDSPFKKPWGP